MKHAVANLLINLASLVKGGNRRSKIENCNHDEDRIWEMEDGENRQNQGRRMENGKRISKPSSILNHPSLPEVEAMLTAHPVWGAEEARATAAFLGSPAGQLFSKRIRSVAAHVAIEGANTGGTRGATTANTIHSAGVSAGWNECVRYIHSLSRVSGEQDTPKLGVASINDRHQPEDEAGLLERLSP